MGKLQDKADIFFAKTDNLVNEPLQTRHTPEAIQRLIQQASEADRLSFEALMLQRELETTMATMRGTALMNVIKSYPELGPSERRDMAKSATGVLEAYTKSLGRLREQLQRRTSTAQSFLNNLNNPNNEVRLK